MTHQLNRLAAALGLAAALPSSAILAQDAEGKRPPLTQSLALKLGPEELTQYTDPSEAGQDRAARLYAEAKRIETEQALARRNLPLVIELDEWREMLRLCRHGSCSIAYIVNGGGTMYSHGGARDCAILEDFLAQLAPRLPLPPGKGSPKASKKIEETIAFLKGLKPLDTGLDKKEAREAKAALAAEVKRIVEAWAGLKGMVQEINSADATKIVEFAADSLIWLKGE